jgi:DNA-binding Lrp family transcriptional regulator
LEKEAMGGGEKVNSRSLKKIELRLIAELMKNSRRSDREIAKALGTSQPTVSRIIKRLEEQGVIKEYTMIPDFTKVGYKILALVFVKLKQLLSQEQVDKARNIARESVANGSLEIVMLERGIGLDYDGVFMTYQKDYSSLRKFIDWLREFEFLDISNIQSFKVSLDDKVRYRPLTFSSLAQDISQTKQEAAEP